MSFNSVRSITSSEWRALASALPVVAAVRLALWILPSSVIVRRTRRMASSASATAGNGRRSISMDSTTSGRISTVLWSVTAASRRIPRATCLTQALAARLLLRRAGISTDLGFGVARDENGAFRAHAWLERDGRILIGGAESRSFARLPDLARGGFATCAERRA